MAKRKNAGPRFSANPIRTIHGVDDPTDEPVAADALLPRLIARVEALESRVAELERGRERVPQVETPDPSGAKAGEWPEVRPEQERG